ncbi:MAG: hypothetical protein AAB587_02380 [Patescibacteria group bacterium]
MGKSIREIAIKIKALLESLDAHLSHSLFVSLCFVLVGLGAFGLGRFSIEVKIPVSVSGAGSLVASPALSSIGERALSSEEVVASKKGSKYHHSWCSGANTIVKENKITFDTKEEAQKAGYTKAANCPEK